MNLFLLADEVMEEQGKEPQQILDERDFRSLVYEIYQRINLMGRWTGSGAWGDHLSDDELLMRRLGQKSSLHIHIILSSCSQMSCGTALSS